MKKYIETTRPFFILTVSFIILIFCIKVFELFTADSVMPVFIIEMLYSNVIASLSLSLCVFIFFNIISIFSRKAAFYVSAILFAIILLSETGLVLYRNTTGLIMGRELIERPLWETVATVKSIMNFWMIAAIFLFIAAFVYANWKTVNRQRQNTRSTFTYLITLILMFVSMPLFFIVKPYQNENIVNKIQYCFHACFLDDSRSQNDSGNYEINKYKINKYKALFPKRKITDLEYPLERVDDIENVLGEYFNESTKKPNIVIIVVESLGADIFGVNEHSYTFTPFLDSLSRHSLLWTNCLSTTPRSFGAIPAITGSVPHGPKGFQFGNIPEHNSLYSILKDNDYETAAFYAGNFSFDKVYDYLIAQKIDYLSPFYQESMKKENKKYDFTYWGYQDKVMFDKSMEIIEQRDKEKTYFDLLITISQHDNRLKLNDKKKVDYYYDKVSKIIATLPEEEQTNKKEIDGHLAAMMYGDDAIRDFVKKYSELYSDGNYIFVITGDHSLNLNPDNPLDAFHVPLIIWSPLLKKGATFKTVVSHNDIVPSLTALLRDNFNMKTPHEIHWSGNGLDTITSFNCDIKTCFLRYTRSIYDGIIENHYYSFENNNRQAYTIKENLQLEKIDNQKTINEIDDKFKAFVYVDNYSYSNNKITKNPIFPHKTYETIEDVIIDSIYCTSSPEKPSVTKPTAVEVFSTDFESKYDEVKVVMTADVMFTGDVWQDQFINLGINYFHDKNQKITSLDNMSKSFVERNHYSDTWMKLEFVKIYSVKDFQNNKIEIYLEPTKKDYMWNPDHSVTLRNVNIKILGIADINL